MEDEEYKEDGEDFSEKVNKWSKEKHGESGRDQKGSRGYFLMRDSGGAVWERIILRVTVRVGRKR